MRDAVERTPREKGAERWGSTHTEERNGVEQQQPDQPPSRLRPPPVQGHRKRNGNDARQLVERNKEVRLEARSTVRVDDELRQPRHQEGDGDERQEGRQRNSAERRGGLSLHSQNLAEAVLV